jgi:glycerol-3-phosphate responsive antiterminator
VLPNEIFDVKNAVLHAAALNELSHCKNSVQFIWYMVDPKGVLTHTIKNMSIYK